MIEPATSMVDAEAPIKLFFFLVFLLPVHVSAQTNGTINVGASITADEKASPWLSASGDFAFGFQQLAEDKDMFLLSIWYNKIPGKTIVWYANDQGNPVARGSTVELNAQNGLVLRDPGGTPLWSTNTITGEASFGIMNDTGNFVLVGGDSSKVWESFKNPTDTLLPGQTMEIGSTLISRFRETNFTKGRFRLRLLQSGDLVLNSINVAADLVVYSEYYNSRTADPQNASNSGNQVIFNETGYSLYILRGNNRRELLSPRSVYLTSDYYHRVSLNFDGVLSQYYHPKTTSAGSETNWTAVRSWPDNICTGVIGDNGSGVCGFNSICRLDDNRRPVCECPTRYSFLDPEDRFSGCTPGFIQSCEETEQGSAAEDLYGFEQVRNVDWPLSDYETYEPYSSDECQRSCLHDCFCAVAIHRDDTCWKKRLPLSNGRFDTGLNAVAFLKFRKQEIDPLSPSRPVPSESKKNDRVLILVGSVLLGSSVFINFLFVAATCLGFFFIYRRKKIVLLQGNGSVETNLRWFKYKELAECTGGFKEELGRGAFGTVYKGVMLPAGSGKFIAVKKLDRMAEGAEKEFKAEVSAIGQTHHKNLVRLLGFCNEGQHRMLVYEYMSNGTLANFLFGDAKPSWNQRTQIAMGIARGLLYLHEECSTQIIHCDIKPQNILLDENYTARISDFGLAKLLMVNQSRTRTGIRGTKGYVAPEWFRNTPITVKVDVYSYGVLLLEIISCRRSLDDLEMGEGERLILTDFVWDCFQERRLDLFVENDREALDDRVKLEKYLKIGLWCIQEDSSLRPTMRMVTQMLEGVLEVGVPPCPFPFTSA